MDKSKQKEVATEMRKQGKDYHVIAEYLAKNGVKTSRGIPSSGYAYYLVNGNTKKRAGAASGKRRASPKLQEYATTTDKWSVLKAIENCSDFTPRTRKALLGLIFQEISG